MDVNADKFRVRSRKRNRQIREREIVGDIDMTTALLILGGLYIFSRIYEARQKGKGGPTVIQV